MANFLAAEQSALVEHESSVSMSPCRRVLPRSGYWQSTGPRQYQEDRVSAFEDFGREGPEGSGWEYYAVYDGHGGAEAVDFVKRTLPSQLLESPLAELHREQRPQEAFRTAFVATEERLADHLLRLHEDVPRATGGLPKTRSVATPGALTAGSCACVALLREDELFIANLGDCRAMLCTHTAITVLTEDHRADSNPEERRRMEELGIAVSSDGYIHGRLGVSRSFGDLAWEDGAKCPGVLASPDVTQHRLQPGTEFLLLACDGIFEKMPSEEAARIVRRSLRTSWDPEAAAQRLVATAERLSEDNLSALVVLFQVPPPNDNGRTAPRLFGPRPPSE